MSNAGRPTEYTEELLSNAREYLEKAEDEEEQQVIGLSAKGTELFKNKLRVNLPSIEGLALHIGISRETIYQWEKDPEKPEFSDIIGRLRAKQAKALIDKGLSGDYNPTIAKVLLTKHGYRDAVDTDITTKGEKIAIDNAKARELAEEYESKLKENL